MSGSGGGYLGEMTKYRVVVRTLDEEGAGIEQSVFIKVHGDRGSLKPIELGTGGVPLPKGARGPFSRNSTSHFTITRPMCGDLRDIEVWHNAPQSWGLGSVEISRGDEQWTFKAPRAVASQTQMDTAGHARQAMRIAGEFALVSNGATRFHLAAKWNRTDELEGMLARGEFEVDARDKLGRTAAHYASLYGAQPALELLAEFGAQFLAADNDGRHCLHHACANPGDTDGLVRLVLRVGGAEVRLREARYRTIDTEDAEARALCADADAFGKTPAHLAAAAGLVGVLQLLESRAGPSLVDREDDLGLTPLSAAALHGQLPAVLCLLDLGADPAHAGAFGMGLLHHAAGTGQEALIRGLLERDLAPDKRERVLAGVNAPDAAGQTPLLLAAAFGHLGPVRALYEHGGNVFHHDADGNSVLHLAAARGSDELLAYAAGKLKVNEENKFGFTPLHVAIEKDNADAVRWLVRNDANVHKKLLSGETPLEFARQRGDETIVWLLEEAVARQIAVPEDKGPLVLQGREDRKKNPAVAAAAAAAAASALEATGMFPGELEDANADDASGGGGRGDAAGGTFSAQSAKHKAVEEAAARSALPQRSPEEIARDEVNRAVESENENLRRLAEHLEGALREKASEIRRLQEVERAQRDALF